MPDAVTQAVIQWLAELRPGMGPVEAAQSLNESEKGRLQQFIALVSRMQNVLQHVGQVGAHAQATPVAHKTTPTSPRSGLGQQLSALTLY